MHGQNHIKFIPINIEVQLSGMRQIKIISPDFLSPPMYPQYFYRTLVHWPGCAASIFRTACSLESATGRERLGGKGVRRWEEGCWLGGARSVTDRHLLQGEEGPMRNRGACPILLCCTTFRFVATPAPVPVCHDHLCQLMEGLLSDLVS